MGGIDVIKVKNFKIILGLTQHKWHNFFILGMAYQLPFKMCNVKKRIGIFMGGIDVIKVKNFQINLALTQQKWRNLFILVMAYQLPFKMCNAKKEFVFLFEVLM